MAKKYYAIKVGRKTGIFADDWNKVKKYVESYPNAEYKGFNNIDEAKAYLNPNSSPPTKRELGNVTITGSMSSAKTKQKNTSAKIKSDGNSICYSNKDWSRDNAKKDIYRYIKERNIVVAYTDGSYNNKTDKAGYGVVYFSLKDKDREPSVLKGELGHLGMHQIIGEVKAVEQAVEKAIKNKEDCIEIRYDYEGVAKWATGEWNATKERTQKYASKMKKLSEKINIVFCKVDAHTGDIFNEEADYLAKQGCKIIK